MRCSPGQRRWYDASPTPRRQTRPSARSTPWTRRRPSSGLRRSSRIARPGPDRPPAASRGTPAPSARHRALGDFIDVGFDHRPGRVPDRDLESQKSMVRGAPLADRRRRVASSGHPDGTREVAARPEPGALPAMLDDRRGRAPWRRHQAPSATTAARPPPLATLARIAARTDGLSRRACPRRAHDDAGTSSVRPSRRPWPSSSRPPRPAPARPVTSPSAGVECRSDPGPTPCVSAGTTDAASCPELIAEQIRCRHRSDDVAVEGWVRPPGLGCGRRASWTACLGDVLRRRHRSTASAERQRGPRGEPDARTGRAGWLADGLRDVSGRHHARRADGGDLGVPRPRHRSACQDGSRRHAARADVTSRPAWSGRPRRAGADEVLATVAGAALGTGVAA